MTAAYPVLLLVACTLVPLESPPRALVADPVVEPPAAVVRDQYVPREGDLLFFTYYKKLWYYIFKFGNTGAPYHVALVVKTPEGTLKLLEAGSLDPTNVMLVDIRPRVLDYQGRVGLRSLRRSPTPQQSSQLTCFALEQLGKPFARKRVGADAFCNRKLSLRDYNRCGVVSTDRPDWYCSELVTSALIEGGIFPIDMLIPNAPFPRDMYHSCPRTIDPWYCPPVELICSE